VDSELTADVLADIEAIRRLTYDYGFYWDTRDLDGYVGCFVPDGVIDSRPADPNIPLAAGHEAIRQLTVYFMALGALIDGGRTEWFGYYGDSYRRTDQGWKFTKRELHPLMPVRSEGLDYDKSR